jgi:hypothetical protein
VIVLTGCQHPLAPAIAGPDAAVTDHAFLDAQDMAPVQKVMYVPDPAVKSAASVAEGGVPESPKPTAAPSASAQQEPEDLTLQLGDCLLTVLKTFARH